MMEMIEVLRRIAEALEEGNDLAHRSLELQERSLKLAERNSNANMAFHLELTEALNNEEQTD